MSRGDNSHLYEMVRVRMTTSLGQPHDSCQPLHLLLTWYRVMGCLKTYIYSKIAGVCPAMQYIVIQVNCVAEKSWSCLGRKWSTKSARCYPYHVGCQSRVGKHFPGSPVLFPETAAIGP